MAYIFIFFTLIYNYPKILYFKYNISTIFILQDKGLHGLPKLVLFTSEDAHYSVKKMASFMGIGTENVGLVKTDPNGKMNVDHLVELVEKAIKEGRVYF